MNKLNHDNSNKVIVFAHLVTNIVIAILFIAQLEAMNVNKPFSSEILPVEIMMLAIFSFYVANLAFILSCSVQITASCKLFLILIIVEFGLLISSLLLIVVSLKPKFRIYCIEYGLLIFLNLSLHISVRIRLRRVPLSEQQKQIKKLQAYKLSKSQMARLSSTQNCSICLGELKGQRVLALPCSPATKHFFHQNCFLKWFSRSRECPICRQDPMGKVKSSLVTQNSLALDSSLSNWRETVQ